MTNKRVLILVLCSRNYLSKISSSAQQDIWKKYKQKYEIFHFVGLKDRNSREVNYIDNQDKNYLLINADDGYKSIAKKTLLAFERVNRDYDFDYIFRTNTSSYVNFSRLENFISNNENILDYCGKKLVTQEGDVIASGAGFFLSRKNIELIINNKNYYEESLPDDVAIARLLKRFDIHPNDSIRKDLKKIPSPNKVFIGKDFHYRCRLDPQYHRIVEPQLIKYLEKATNDNNIFIYIDYFFLSLIFKVANLNFIRKLIQKYYSFKFYGELHLRKKLLYKKTDY